MREFRWLNAEAIPPACDLRRRGWRLVDPAPERDSGEVLWLGDATNLGPSGWKLLDEASLAQRACTVLVGVNCSLRRSQLLRQGTGEVLDAADLDELELRAERTLTAAACEPRRRSHRGLTLDLLAREAFSAGRGLGLHPREFGLLWRLMATPGEPVSKSSLLRDVWRLRHEPETNSLAVHASRLRAKLTAVGYPDLIVTEPQGYAFAVASAVPLTQSGSPLDDYVRLVDDPGKQ